MKWGKGGEGDGGGGEGGKGVKLIPPPQKKLSSKSPALLGLKFLPLLFYVYIAFVKTYFDV